MKHFLSIFLIIPGFCIQLSAQAPGTWKSYMSYYNTISVAEADNNVFAATKGSVNGNFGSLYSYNKEDQSIRIFSKETGLKDTQIAKIGYNQEVKTLLIIYSNGNIDLLSEEGIYNISQLMSNTNVPDKTVNSIFFTAEFAYLSTNFGIIKLDMKKKEISDTYRLNKSVYASSIFGEYFYAATTEGVLSARTDSNLLDRDNWISYNVSIPEVEDDIRYICTFQNTLCFFQKGRGVYYQNERGGEYNRLYRHDYMVWVKMENDKLVLMLGNSTVVFTSLGHFDTLNTGEVYDFSSLKGNVYWIAAGEEGLKGASRKVSSNEFEWSVSGIQINSPKRDAAFYLNFNNDKLMVAGGGYGTQPFNYPGTVMTYENNEWYNFDETVITSQSSAKFRNATRIAVDPTNENHYFVSTWGDGVYEFENNEFKNVYNQTNSTLKSFSSSQKEDIRVDGICFDKNNNLWMLNSEVPNGLVVRNPNGEWITLSSSKFTPLSNQFALRQILVTKNSRNKNHKWALIFNARSNVYGSGIFAFDDKGDVNNPSGYDTRHIGAFYTTSNERINASTFYCMVEDLNGQIWMGTNLGPVICPNPASALDNPNNNVLGQRIIYEDENGEFSYFLDGQSVTAIAVDGGNRKWIGTQNSGLFIVSPDGTQIIENFSAEDSPLPSNSIQSIAINPQTGEGFIGTDKGIVSYMGGATEGNEDYSNVYAFPNPVRPEYQDQVTITGLMMDAHIKITDVSGNLITQGKSWGGQYSWDCRRPNGERVATGVYLVFAATPETGESVVTKIMVVK